MKVKIVGNIGTQGGVNKLTVTFLDEDEPEAMALKKASKEGQEIEMKLGGNKDRDDIDSLFMRMRPVLEVEIKKAETRGFNEAMQKNMPLFAEQEKKEAPGAAAPAPDEIESPVPADKQGGVVASGGTGIPVASQDREDF